MTYDVLEKVGKKELIAWMRKNVFLPRISDEQFLKDVKLIRLFAEEEELLNKDRALIEKLEAAKDNHIEFMKLMIESDKLNQQLDKLSKQINKCMGFGRKTMREKLIDDVHSELMGLLQRTPYIRCEDVNRQYEAKEYGCFKSAEKYDDLEWDIL